MKTEIQIQHFLNSQSFKSQADYEMISIFLNRNKLSPKLSPKYSDDGIDIAVFTDWFNNGFASGEVAEFDGTTVILGHCSLEEAQIEARFYVTGVEIVKMAVGIAGLSKVSEKRSNEAIRALSSLNMQFDRENETISKKYMPKTNERVEFYNDKIRGLGVVREFRPEDDYVELYCYYIYTTGEIGYSMHEKGICTVHDFNFSPMSVSSLRRMNNELNKHGKTWYDKLHRIEPLVVKVEKGEKYWYINDKLKVVQETEKDTPTSQQRYIAGNYFTSLNDAVAYQGMFADILRDRLAMPENKTEGE